MPERILIAYSIIAIVVIAAAIALWLARKRHLHKQRIIRGYREWGRSAERREQSRNRG